MELTEMVFESFFDGVAGVWTLRRVPAPRKRVVIRKRAVATS